MAKKSTAPKSFKVDTENEVITVYTDVAQPKVEEKVMSMYIKAGYNVKFMKKPKTITVDGIRAEMKDDEDALKEFEKLYKDNEGDTVGFHKAMKYYNQWKAQKKEKKQENSNEEEHETNEE